MIAEPMAEHAEPESDLWDRVETALDRLRPMIQSDGGDVELASIEDGVASVRMLGACVGCPKAGVTLQRGIAYTVQQAAPEIRMVVALPWDEDDRWL